MPRDGSGNYTLPAGNPVVTNTIITSTWANTTLADIAAQLNNVFTRDGLLGPTGPFKILDGTVAAPGLAWNSEPGMGWFRVAAGQIAFAQGGVSIWGQSVVGNNVYQKLSPKIVGAEAVISVSNAPGGSPNYNQMDFKVAADGSYSIVGAPVGTAAAKDLNFTGFARALFNNIQVISPLFTVAGSSFQLGLSIGNPIIQWAPNWFFQWTVANGRLDYFRNGAPTTTFWQNGDFNAGGNIYHGTNTEFGLVRNPGSSRQLKFTSDNWKLEWQDASGNLVYYNNAGTPLFYSEAGNGDFYAGGALHAARMCYVNPSDGIQHSPQSVSSNPSVSTLHIANPAWNQIGIRAVHYQGSWAGYEMIPYVGGISYFHFRMSGTTPQLWAAGDGGNFNCTTTGYGFSSDARFKEYIKDIVDPVGRFKQLRFREFLRKHDHNPDFPHEEPLPELGMIAQEVLETQERNAIYESKGRDEDDVTLMIKADQIHFLTGAALQATLAHIDALEARIAALEAA